MIVYKVGGCVRDEILGREINDIDYVVINSNHDEMISNGFKQVGASFPVYLHPNTNEEYALARTEKSIDNSHQGFEFETNNVSLEDDLKRRDLTINSMAMDEEGNIIDPFGGCKHIAEKALHPTSEAFKEDPLRILRAARFRAQLGGEWYMSSQLRVFSIILRQQLQTLSKERIHLELIKALKTKTPSLYFRSLLELNVLNWVYPEIYQMTEVEHDNQYHQEGSIFNHVMMVIDKCNTVEARIAALFHDVGKIPCKVSLGTFKGHSGDEFVTPAFDIIKKKYGFSKFQFDIAYYVALNHHRWQEAAQGNLTTKKLLDLMLYIKDLKKLDFILEAVYADMQGRIGKKKVLKYTKADFKELYFKIHNHKTNCKGLSTNQIINKVRHEKLCIVKYFEGESND